MRIDKTPYTQFLLSVFEIICLCFFLEKVVHVENTASRKVSGRSWKGFRKGNRKVFYSVQNAASRKVSGRSRESFRKQTRKVLFNFPHFSIVGSPEKVRISPG